ncbi:MAG TPA: hypothetical protein VEU74_10530 [Gemmatimonadales bacterium]|nr:hypothetical protein [Gemmatimonadales bacterium]
MKRALLLIALLSRSGPIVREAPREPESYALAQCAVVQLGASPRLYLTRPSGEVEAVDLRTGRVLWHTKEAAFPLMARQDRLLALLPVVPGEPGWRLGVLSARSGAVRTRLAPWGPGGSVGDGMGSSMSLESLAANGRVYVVWRSRSWTVSGVVHPAEAVHTASGAAEVDVVRATLVPVSRELPEPSLPIHSDGGVAYHTGAFHVDDVTAVAATRFLGQKFQLVVHRQRGGAILPDVILCEPPWNSAGVSVSVDRRHVLGACEDSATARRGVSDVVVQSTVSGERVGHFISEAWPVSSLVWGHRLVYFVPDRVSVVDLVTGRRLFERPLRDLRYHGTYPPSVARPPGG